MWFHNFKMRFWKEYRDYTKCIRTINSCRNFYHASSACKMTNNFGKMYGLKNPWSVLDQQAHRQFMFYVDQFEYQDRLEHIGYTERLKEVNE